jgi:hypothetical protein
MGLCAAAAVDATTRTGRIDMSDIVTYVPAASWITTELLRPAAYGALAGICINMIVRWMQ